MNDQQVRTIALQASGEYVMNHIADVMEMVQDTWARHDDDALDEETLIAIEAEVKAMAEELTRQTSRRLVCMHVRTTKWPAVNAALNGAVR